MGSLRKGVGTRIRELRKADGLTLEMAADRIGMDPVYWGRIERAEINISLDTLQKLATALKVEIIEFFSTNETRDRSQETLLRNLLVHLTPASRQQLVTLAKHLAQQRR